jgi:hypothetical protein
LCVGRRDDYRMVWFQSRIDVTAKCGGNSITQPPAMAGDEGVNSTKAGAAPGRPDEAASARRAASSMLNSRPVARSPSCSRRAAPPAQEATSRALRECEFPVFASVATAASANQAVRANGRHRLSPRLPLTSVSQPVGPYLSAPPRVRFAEFCTVRFLPTKLLHAE